MQIFSILNHKLRRNNHISKNPFQCLMFSKYLLCREVDIQLLIDEKSCSETDKNYLINFRWYFGLFSNCLDSWILKRKTHLSLEFDSWELIFLFCLVIKLTFQTSSYTQILTDMFPFWKMSLILYQAELLAEICQNAVEKNYLISNFSHKKTSNLAMFKSNLFFTNNTI